MSLQALTALDDQIALLRDDLRALTATVTSVQDRLAAVEIRISATERSITHKRDPGRWATWTDDDLAMITEHLATWGPQLKTALARHYGRAMLAEAIDREFIYESTRNGARVLAAAPTEAGTSARAIIDYLARNGPTWRSARPADRTTLADRFDRNRIAADLRAAVATGQIVKGTGGSAGGRPPSIYAIRPPLDGPDLPQIVDGVPVTWQI